MSILQRIRDWRTQRIWDQLTGEREGVELRRYALELFKDRGLIDPEIEHELPYDGMMLFCARGEGDKRDWLLGS